VGYLLSILVVLEGAVVTFLRIIENWYLNDSLNVTHFSSKWQFAPLRNGVNMFISREQIAGLDDIKRVSKSFESVRNFKYLRTK
jgi:hypothetical protein